jgi:hypothetical protein
MERAGLPLEYLWGHWTQRELPEVCPKDPGNRACDRRRLARLHWSRQRVAIPNRSRNLLAPEAIALVNDGRQVGICRSVVGPNDFCLEQPFYPTTKFSGHPAKDRTQPG